MKSDKVEWVSSEQEGEVEFDIFSQNVNDSERYLEVKNNQVGYKNSNIFFEQRIEIFKKPFQRVSFLSPISFWKEHKNVFQKRKL